MLERIQKILEENYLYYYREGELSISEGNANSYGKVAYCVGTVLPTFLAIFSIPTAMEKETSFLYKAASLPLDASRIHGLLQDLKNGEKEKIKLLQVALTVSSLVGTFFYHPIGLVISTGQDLIFSISKFRGNNELNYEKIENFLQIVSKISYFACFFASIPEISLLFLLAQILVNSSHLYKNLSQIWHEGFSVKELAKVLGNLALLIIRTFHYRWALMFTLEMRGFISTEYMVKESLGEEYLHFIPGDAREKLLVLSASHDPGGTFASFGGSFSEDLETLGEKRFDVRFHTISTVSEIKEEIDLAKQAGKVMGLILRGHGYLGEITFGSGADGTLCEKTLSEDLFEGLAPGCVIVLDSCEAAFNENSIAYRICNLAKRTVYASTGLVKYTESFLTRINPLEWHLGEHTVKIVPKAAEALSEIMA